MSRRLAALVVGAALGVVAVVLLYLAVGRGDRPEAAPPSAPGAATGPVAVAGGEPWSAELFFPSPRGILEAERRDEAPVANASEAVARVVAELLAGPRQEGLLPLFPEPVELARALVLSDGVAYVDLRGAEGGPPPPAGSETEMLRVYALVNSIVASVPEAERVALLWNGEQRPSLSGHVNTGSPLAPNRALLVSPP